MKLLFSILLFSATTINSFGQDDIAAQTKPIVDEGKRLYMSEMASWYGTDIFLEKFTKRDKIGGYFSYAENDITKCLFFLKGDTAKVIGTISFDSTYDVRNAAVDLNEREFTKEERALHAIRTLALKAINSDTLFKTYKNTNLNLIPIISNGEKKVYVLTAPKDNGVVIFGNDYLINFDDESNITDIRQLHRNIIIMNYGQKTEDGNEITGAMHTHLGETSDFITATDICTLMLYEKFTKWKQYNIISQNYFSI